MATPHSTPQSRPARAARAVADWAYRVRTAAPRPIGWWLDKPQRLTALVWLVALMVVGLARMAVADDIIVGPDMAGGGPKTLFERYSLFDYRLLVKPTEEASGWFNMNAGMLHVIGWVNTVLLWASLGLLFGGLTLLEWFLNLSIYRDSAGEIDQAVQMVANQVFWPLISATVAIGAFIAYARWRGEGRGFVSDMLWVFAAAALAMGFAMGPSTIVGELNGLRQTMASGMVAGASDFTRTSGNPVGYDTPPLTGDPQTVATRQLTSGMWSAFGATPWCYAQFHDLDICRKAGSHALAEDDKWKAWMDQLEDGQSPPVFEDETAYIRGQDMARTGVVLLLLVMVLPLAYLLVRLILAGLVAVVGLLLMLVVGLLFLAFWPIEGFFRRVGTQYWLYTLGLLLQSLFITIVIAGIMVVSTILATQLGKYGFFLTTVLHIALLMAAVKARSWLDTLTTFGGAGSTGIGTALIARSMARTVVKGAAALGSGGTAAAAGALGAASRAGSGPSWASARRASADQPRNRSGTGAMTGLDNGPIKASSSRMPQPGAGSQLPGSGRAALTAGSGSSGTTGPGGGPGGGGPPRPSSGGPTPAAGGGGAAAATKPRPSGGSGGVVDGQVAPNAETLRRARVFAAPPGGRGLAPLDEAPAPRATQQDSPRPRPRRWWRRGRHAGGDQL